MARIWCSPSCLFLFPLDFCVLGHSYEQRGELLEGRDGLVRRGLWCLQQGGDWWCSGLLSVCPALSRVLYLPPFILSLQSPRAPTLQWRKQRFSNEKGGIQGRRKLTAGVTGLVGSRGDTLLPPVLCSSFTIFKTISLLHPVKSIKGQNLRMFKVTLISVISDWRVFVLLW